VSDIPRCECPTWIASPRRITDGTAAPRIDCPPFIVIFSEVVKQLTKMIQFSDERQPLQTLLLQDRHRALTAKARMTQAADVGNISAVIPLLNAETSPEGAPGWIQIVQGHD
jgi:hypothetical protein